MPNDLPSEKEPFYDETGKITDIDNAHKVALAEQNFRDFEEDLRTGKGLANQWEQNLESAKTLYSKYNKAFKVVNDPIDGTIFEVLKFTEHIETLHDLKSKNKLIRDHDTNELDAFGSRIKNFRNFKDAKYYNKIEELGRSGKNKLLHILFYEDFAFGKYESITLSKKGLTVTSLEVKKDLFSGKATDSQKIFDAVEMEVYHGNLTNVDKININYPNSLRDLSKEDQIKFLQALEIIHQHYSKKEKTLKIDKGSLNKVIGK